MTTPPIAEGSAVLLVTHSYRPAHLSASRRPFGLARPGLRRLGYRVIVLTSDAWASATELEGDLIQSRT